METASRAAVVENVTARRSRWTTLRRCGCHGEWRVTFLGEHSNRAKKHEDERRTVMLGRSECHGPRQRERPYDLRNPCEYYRNDNR
jgi:hypothetical protein